VTPPANSLARSRKEIKFEANPVLRRTVVSTIRDPGVKLVNRDNKTHETWIMIRDLATLLLEPWASNNYGFPLKQVMNFKNLIMYWISFYCI
jgi:hypothetical protein